MSDGEMTTQYWWVYILLCSDGTLYTGATNRLTVRVEAHNRGQGAKYTRSRLPVELVYVEEADDKSSALKREAQIKKLTRKQKIALVEGGAA
jgi:putative endonuclease